MSGYSDFVYLTYMQNTSCEMLGWMTHKLESRLPEEISITSDMGSQRIECDLASEKSMDILEHI